MDWPRAHISLYDIAFDDMVVASSGCGRRRSRSVRRGRIDASSRSESVPVVDLSQSDDEAH